MASSMRCEVVVQVLLVLEKRCRRCAAASCSSRCRASTLINESISTAAGSIVWPVGPAIRVSEDDPRRWTVLAERYSTYQVRRVFKDGEDPIEPLDEVTDVDERFGSYLKLTQSPEFRYAEATRGPS